MMIKLSTFMSMFGASRLLRLATPLLMLLSAFGVAWAQEQVPGQDQEQERVQEQPQEEAQPQDLQQIEQQQDEQQQRPERTTCSAASESCLDSCKRFDIIDARRQACRNFCVTRATDRTACPVAGAATTSALPIEQFGAAPTTLTLSSKKEAVREREKNVQMIAAIRDGNLKFIRRLVEMHGLSPTYVYGYDFNAQTRQHDGRAIRLRLTDVYNDTNTLRGDSASLDRILALFLELGMDVKATLAVNVPSADGSSTTSVARTAWGPSLRMMETARDRAARMRAFEMSLQAGLTPNDDFSDWLFAELPQVCGRDRSKFAIQVFDLLVKYLGPTLAESLWRDGPRGPETLADLLDRSLPPAQAKNSYQATQFAIQDSVWENCTHLSKRVDRFLTQGK